MSGALEMIAVVQGAIHPEQQTPRSSTRIVVHTTHADRDPPPPAGNIQTNNSITNGELGLYNGVSNNLVADNEMSSEVGPAVRNFGPAALTPRAA